MTVSQIERIATAHVNPKDVRKFGKYVYLPYMADGLLFHKDAATVGDPSTPRGKIEFRDLEGAMVWRSGGRKP